MAISKKLEEMIIKLRLKDLLRLFYHFYEDLIENGAVKKNIALKNAYKGQRCFILATGVSLNEIDLSLLKKEYTFGCGHLYSHRDFSKLDINFYTDTEPLRNFLVAPINFYSRINNACNNPETIFFLRAANKRFIEKNGMFHGRKVHYVKPSLPMKQAAVQSNDLSKRITMMDGTIFLMMAAAIYMGFSELYLCGCGYTYEPNLYFHFYDEYPEFPSARFKPFFPVNISKEQKEFMLNNFAQSHGLEINASMGGLSIYKSRREGQYEIVSFVRRNQVNENHVILQKFANEKGVKIFNIVPDDFKSPVYEKVSWNFVVTDVLRV